MAEHAAATPATTTVVIDAGARYGIHPTWKGFSGDLRYLMFEPDRREADRLAHKYAGRGGAVAVIPQALGEREGSLAINVLRHHGQSTAFEPNPGSFWFGKTRPNEGDVVARYEAPVTSIDDYCAGSGLALDFLKSDTEGSELAILKGAARQLEENVLGVRCEVQFEPVFLGAPSFADIYTYMTGKGFFLLNLDYAGAGSPCNGLFAGDRYGILTGTDAVWLRHPSALFVARAGDDPGATAARTAKYAAFCLISQATDVAMDVLLQAKREHGIDLAALQGTALHRWLDVAVQRLFYALQQNPAHDRGRLQAVYAELFGRALKQFHEFFESEEVNPT